ncbi:MAG: ion transporter [Leptospiraceae bacterium]|nr:ion transporter [Leptospiraceae bacterium]MCB1321699.1 ion transporter [Leptospiraceae bacterium]
MYVMRMLDPNSRWKEAWDLIQALAILLASIEIPVRIAFQPELTGWHLTAEAIVTVLFLADVGLNFFTAVPHRNRLITDRRYVARTYLKTWFVPDLLAALPLFLLPGVWEAGRMVKTLHLLHLNRLLKLTRVVHNIVDWQRHQLINAGIFRLVFVGFGILLIAHWIACGWILIGGVGPTAGDLDTYVDALYWTITTLTTVGYGDITPDGRWEKLYTMMVMVAGVGCYGYVIGNIASMLANLDLVRSAQLKKIDQVDALLKYRRVPPMLRQEVKDYYEHVFESHATPQDEALLAELPLALRAEIALVTHRDFIHKVPLFRAAGEEFVRTIVLRLKTAVYPPGALIIKKGEVGDCMYFIDNGSVDVISSEDQHVYTTLSEGDYFGEIALTLSQPRSATVRSRDFCDLYVLYRRDFEEALEQFPGFARHVRRTVKHRFRDIERRHARRNARQKSTGD